MIGSIRPPRYRASLSASKQFRRKIACHDPPSLWIALGLLSCFAVAQMFILRAAQAIAHLPGAPKNPPIFSEMIRQQLTYHWAPPLPRPSQALFWLECRSASVRRFVVAGRAAGLAVQQTIDAQPHIQLRLAQHAKLLAPAALLGLLALSADDLVRSRFRRHEKSVATHSGRRK
jgi:hypothetical protein